ncbi:MAG: LLM class F420-dependent oxidoreductase [Acidimicrobiales bacterium]|nr:MAG: LLM class F420-dependent oxidoreductase [Acidimicrobiales bacterium]
MKLDAGLIGSLDTIGDRAAEMEAVGYDGLLSVEINHDPFFPLVVAAGRTENVQLATGIAVAFARNPMLLANIGWDLQAYSKGRFTMGLGSQIKPHITKRFSMPWSKPAARMQDMIEAMHAIWDSWNNGEKLQHRGEFYTHTLMTPMFDPGPNPYGNPRVSLAGVGPLMTKVAGRVADGFISHAFQTPDYFRDVTMPALEQGLAERGRSRSDIEISMPLFVTSGANEEDLERRKQGNKQQIAFYGSTPAYKPVLDHHGWGDAHTDLNRMSKEGKWVEMADVIDDEILDAFSIVGEPGDVAPKLAERYAGIVDRVQFAYDDGGNEEWAAVGEQIRAI